MSTLFPPENRLFAFSLHTSDITSFLNKIPTLELAVNWQSMDVVAHFAVSKVDRSKLVSKSAKQHFV